MLRPVCVILLALSAAACGGSDDANSRAPANKILARSTTDEMLALQDVQSQAPLAEPEVAVPGGKKNKSGGETDAAAAPTDEIAPAPVIESPPPTDAIGAAISGQAPPVAQ